MLRTFAAALILITIQLAGATAQAAPTVSVNFSQRTGVGPFDANDDPGNDSSAANAIIRTNDAINYRFEIAVLNEDATNVVVRMSVAPGLALSLPPFCRTSGVSPLSSISGDAATGYSVVCNVGDIGQGSQVLYAMPAVVEPDRPHGSTVSLTSASVETDQTALESFPGTTSTVSAAPRLDLLKDAQTRLVGRADGPNGEPGIIYSFPIVIRAKNGAKGNELVTADMTFTDDLSGVSPNARLYQGWSGALASACIQNTPNSTYRVWQLPNGSTRTADGGPGGPGAGPIDRSVWDSGTISCTTPAPGGTTTVTISGADLTARHAPTKGSNNTALPADQAYLVSGNLIIWIPSQDITDAGGELSIDNVYENFNALSISNAPNVDPDLSNNSKTFVARDGTGSRSFYNHLDHNSFNLLPGQTNRRSGDGQILPGTVFATRHYQYNRAWVSKTRYEDYVFCTSFDNTRQRIFEITSGQGAKIHTSGTFDGGQPAFTIEYGTGTFGTTATCDDADSPVNWHTDVNSVPGGIGAITKVRAKAAYIAPPGGNSTQVIVSLVTRFEALPNAVGTRLASYGSYQSTAFSGGAWLLPTYNIDTGLGRYGDRLTITEALVRVNKDTVPSGKTNALAGDPLSFMLTPSITTPTPSAPITTDVTLTDTVPALYEYTLSSSSPPASSITVNPDGTTTLVWEFPDSEVNQPLPQITYDVLVKPTAPDQSEPQNIAVIYSPGDASTEAQRSDEYTILIVNPAGFSVFKSANPVLNRPNDEFGFDLVYANTGTSDFPSVVMIDVLPNEDVLQSPPTNFDGIALFKSASGQNGETFEYTRRDPTLVESDPNHASNQPAGATVWCSTFSGGTCPGSAADVTAVRMTSPAFLQGQPARVINIRMQGTGNDAYNVYSNRFTAQAEGLAFPITSPVATARVRTADVSLTKSVAGPEPSTPETVVFTLTANNAGPHNTGMISVLDNLPAGYAYESHDGGIYDPLTGIWSITDIGVGSSRSIDITATVLPGGNYINRTEVAAQSYADPDSTPANGVPGEDDTADAAILARLEGVLFEDNGAGSGNAHNALIDGMERRGSFGTISIETAGGTLLATAIINADGSWSAVLPDSPPEDLILTVQPKAGYLTISETTAGLPGLTNPVTTDGTFTFRPSSATEYTALDMGLIAEPILTQNQSGNVEAGQVIDLGHRYVSTTAGSVTFSIKDEISNPDGVFTTTLFEDVSCDGTPDYPLNAARSVIAGETVCLIARTQASAGAGTGATFTYGIEALTLYQNTMLSNLLRNDDSVATSGEGGGDVVLRKLVTNVTQSTPEGVSNMGKIGDMLRYRLILTNPGTTAATDVQVFDATPAYTVLTGAPSVTTVGNVTCTLVTPASVTPDYAGPLAWQCPGSFPPGSTGSLTFDVVIAP